MRPLRSKERLEKIINKAVIIRGNRKKKTKINNYNIKRRVVWLSLKSVMAVVKTMVTVSHDNLPTSI